MKTDNNKTLITSTVTATVLLLAFQPASAFNPQPEPPGADQMSPVTLPGKDRLTAPTLKPAVAQPSVKAKPLAAPPPPVRKPRAIEPGNDEPHAHAIDPGDDGYKPATAQPGVKAKPLAAPPPLGIKPHAIDPGDAGMPAIKPRAMEPLDKK